MSCRAGRGLRAAACPAGRPGGLRHCSAMAVARAKWPRPPPPGPAAGPVHRGCGRRARRVTLLDGTAQLLSGDRVVTAERGDLVIVPPGLDHAFAAAPGENADILIVTTPGIERFEYFRHLERIAYGKVPPESLLDVQELYDTHFTRSEPWNTARA